MARVVAVERGHDGIDVREVGAQFDVPDARLKDGSTWFVPVGKEPKETPKAATVARPPGAGPVKGSKSDKATADTPSDS